jgi:hypothetical protein
MTFDVAETSRHRSASTAVTTQEIGWPASAGNQLVRRLVIANIDRAALPLLR